jgi:hypothetical protein
MPRPSVNGEPLTGAERQALYRAARAAGAPVVRARRPAPDRSRPTPSESSRVQRKFPGDAVTATCALRKKDRHSSKRDAERLSAHGPAGLNRTEDGNLSETVATAIICETPTPWQSKTRLLLPFRPDECAGMPQFLLGFAHETC